MASKRMIRREAKRIRLQRHQPKRQELKRKQKDPTLSLDEKYQIIAQLEKLPRDSSPIRLSKRCEVTGRARGVLTKRFRLCRHKLREFAMRGEVPGLVKSSW